MISGTHGKSRTCMLQLRYFSFVVRAGYVGKNLALPTGIEPVLSG